MPEYPRLYTPPQCAARRDGKVRLKYAVDRVFAVVALGLLSPLFALVALAIKWNDRGPVFFLQDRHGEEGKLFKIFKFRSMIVDADRYLDEQGRVTIDNRVTWVGKLLRLTSIDELPQLINILRGEMSLIGPRPLPPAHYGKLNETQHRRFGMRPGLTGLAQINGRNTLKWSERLAYDVRYVQDYSWPMDLAIFFKTFRVVLSQEGIVLDRNPQQADDLTPKSSGDGDGEAHQVA
jgi:lipopolysaccharide/colanic/teichoic acid biosynthesis glycosyltransferase